MLNPLDYKLSELNSLQPSAGMLLISEPFMNDNYFKRALVLLVEHSEHGSMGFIINKPLGLQVEAAIRDFPEFQGQIFVGGPVSPERLFYVHTIKGVEGSIEIGENLFWGGEYDQVIGMIEKKMILPNQIRFFQGYSGWDKEQLEKELLEDSWIITTCNGKDLFTKRPQTLWQDTLKQLGQPFTVMANFPEDPAMN